MSRIRLLPLGSADRDMVAALRPALEADFDVVAEVGEIDLDLDQFLDPRRLQYNSTALITHLNGRYVSIGGMRGDSPSLLAVVDEDLFIPILTYVFGEAQLGGRVAVVSYHRLQNERYGLPRDQGRLFERLHKEAVHELGHVFGLLHCPARECAMHISTYVEDIDMKLAALCPSCHQQLATLARA